MELGIFLTKYVTIPILLLTAALILVYFFYLVAVEVHKILNEDKNNKRKIEEKSNVIQYDQMGYPLRLVIMSSGEQIWIDAHERDGDVVLEWSRQED